MKLTYGSSFNFSTRLAAFAVEMLGGILLKDGQGPKGNLIKQVE